MKYYILALALIIVCLSCSNDDDNPPTPDNYTPMTIGSYWIYQTHIIRLDGTETIATNLDSVVITGDSIINGIKYYVFEGTDFYDDRWRILSLRRVDGDKIVDAEGLTHFSSTNFSDTLYQYTKTHNNDDWVSVHFRMNQPLEPIAVPAGVFDVLDFRGSVQSNIMTPYPLPRFVHNYYSLDVGLVLRNTFSFSGGTTLEERLVRYGIQN